jgi:CelD/BcsL family acetyltransferase involved in cellulose biosynthesis
MPRQLELIDPYTPRAEAIWRDLERTARPTYFLTWGWIENWLAMLPREEAPQLAVIREGAAVTGAFFLGRRTLLRHGVLPSRAVYLNATGVPSRDELCIEHNGILGLGCSLEKLIDVLPEDWDELFLPGVDQGSFGSLELPRGYKVRVTGTVPSPYVDLAQVRASRDYLKLISSNTRSQIRRSFRKVGTCKLEVAATLEDALAIYEEMVELHTASWRARNEPGVFADPWFKQFHRRLIEQRFAHGEIQLARLRNGEQTIGCLYNLVANGRVLFYQSGLATYEDAAIKPGLMCHAAAIEHCAAAGHEIYDLLGGSARYKESLSTGKTELAWVCVQRARLRFALEDRVRGWKHAVARLRKELPAGILWGAGASESGLLL